MSTPGFVAELSLYNSGKSYRSTSSGAASAALTVTPQMKCEEYQCAPGGDRGWPPPMYCIRCEGSRLK